MIITFCLLLLLLGIRLYWDHRVIHRTSYTISSSKLPNAFDGYTILQLTDLHNRSFGNNLLQKIEKENPNIVVMTGDMVSFNHDDFTPFLDLAKEVSAKFETYYIKGNHEVKLPEGKYEYIEQEIQSYGIHILDNSKTLLQKDDSHISLYGMWLSKKNYLRKLNGSKINLTHDDMQKLLGNPDRQEFNILLSHIPLFFETYAEWGADLIFCGHVHGGMLRIPGLGGVFAPERTFFPKYDKGKYEMGTSTMILSSGLSRGESLFRLFNPPEYVVVTLHSQK